MTHLYKKLLKVGVVDSQVQAAETKRLFRDMFKDPSAVDKSLVTRVPQKVGSETRRKLLKGYAKLQDAYVAEDDFWKIINWNLERNRYSQIVDQLGVTQTNFKHLINKDLPNKSFLMVKGSNSTGLNKIIQNLSMKYNAL